MRARHEQGTTAPLRGGTEREGGTALPSYWELSWGILRNTYAVYLPDMLEFYEWTVFGYMSKHIQSTFFPNDKTGANPFFPARALLEWLRPPCQTARGATVWMLFVDALCVWMCKGSAKSIHTHPHAPQARPCGCSLRCPSSCDRLARCCSAG